MIITLKCQYMHRMEWFQWQEFVSLNLNKLSEFEHSKLDKSRIRKN